MTIPELPYEDVDGEQTAGWSGSESSHDRARKDALDGTASLRQKRALDLVTGNRDRGMTWKELSTITGEHHGQTSGVLSVLHQTGHIARLTQRRLGCQIYVHPHYIDGRAQSPYRKRVRTVVAVQAPLTEEQLTAVAAAQERLARIPDGGQTSHAMACLFVRDLRILLDIVEERM